MNNFLTLHTFNVKPKQSIMEKKVKTEVSARVDLLLVAAQKVGSRQTGQFKKNQSVRLNGLSQVEALDRYDKAIAVLTGGAVTDKAVKTPVKVTNATLAKAKGDLTKAKNKIAALEKELAETKAKIPSASPVKE